VNQKSTTTTKDPSKKPNRVVLRLTLAAALLASQAANAAVNLIDQTWGTGVGSFEPGVFTVRCPALRFQCRSRRPTTLPGRFTRP